MNCCDEYGNCRQGRDCPVRQERIERVRELAKKSRNRDGILEVIAPLIGAAMMLLVFLVASVIKASP